MKRVLTSFLLLAVTISRAVTPNTLWMQATASAPAGDDWLYIAGPTNDVRKLAPSYYLSASLAATTYQPKSSILSSLTAFSTPNSLFYRDSSGNIQPVTIGSGLAFNTSTGALTATGVGSGDMLKSTYDTNNDGIADHAALADAVPWSGVSSKPPSTAAAGFTNGATIDAWGTKAVPSGVVADLTSAQTISGKSIDASQLTGTVNAARLPSTSVTPATYGDSTHVAQVAIGPDGRVTSASNVAIASSTNDEIPFTIDGGGSTITATIGAPQVMQYACTLVGWALAGDTTGSIAVTLSKGTPSGGTVSLSSVSTAPALSSAQVATGSLTPISVAAGDCIQIAVTGTPSGVQKVSFKLKITRP